VEVLNYLFGSEEGEQDLNELPQLILLDLNLPRISGLEVLQRIRQNKRTQLLPVVVLTTSQEEQDRLQSYLLHANSYIRKPVEFNKFIETVEHLGLYWLVLNESPPPPK
jgi:CheY-like chemotaxis protein